MIYWFRTDLRLSDNPAWQQAYRSSRDVVPVFVHEADAEAQTRWGFTRSGPHRRAFLREALNGLRLSLAELNLPLLECEGPADAAIYSIARRYESSGVMCEDIAAPYEREDVASLRAKGLEVHNTWQSSLLDPGSLPFPVDALPESFTSFRKRVEAASCVPRAPLQEVVEMPVGALEREAHAQIEDYFSGGFAQTYKSTRDSLHGVHVSSRWSRWLALGIVSPHQLYQALKENERARGANESTYWLWFELLWRDYFRFLHLKYGARLYRARGLSISPNNMHNAVGFERWCAGQTGVTLVDAGMRELRATGYLSNRMRQIVASYLVYELGGDYRAGAAWFEHSLVDYDPYSNQGNWLYIAGRGSDPRGGRRFDIAWQTAQHDADGAYRRRWS